LEDRRLLTHTHRAHCGIAFLVFPTGEKKVQETAGEIREHR